MPGYTSQRWGTARTLPNYLFVLLCRYLCCSVVIVLYCLLFVLFCYYLFCSMYRLCVTVYCTVLYCTVLYCIVLYCTVLYCTVLYCTVLYCTVPLPLSVYPIAVDKYIDINIKILILIRNFRNRLFAIHFDIST